MKIKAKGFTLIEVIISLAITTVILGVVGTFFITNNRTLSEADARSTLQKEGENIQNGLIDKAYQCSNIHQLSKWTGSPTINLVDSSTLYYTELTDPGLLNSVRINSIEFLDKGDSIVSTTDDKNIAFSLSGKTLKVTVKDTSNNTLYEKILSENVVSMKIRPLDATLVNRNTTSFDSTKAVEVVLGLEIKRGYNNITYPVSTVVKFRN